MKKGKHKRSVKMRSTGHTSPLMPLRPSSSISSSSKWYRDCRIFLDRFMDVLFEKEYSRLTIEGNPSEEILKEAWRAIYAQYCELMQDGQYNELLDKTKKMQEMNARIVLLDGIVLQLQLDYDPLLIQYVNEMAIPLALTPDEDPVKKLKQVQGRMKRMIFELKKLENEVEALQNIQAEQTGIEHFEDWLSIMSRSYGYAVLAKDITVAQFIRNQKKLNQQSLKQQKNGN